MNTAMVYSLWNNSLISISILRDYWLETMRDGHKHLLIYLDFPPEALGWCLFTVCFYGAKVSICILLDIFFVDILKNYRRTMKINNDA